MVQSQRTPPSDFLLAPFDLLLPRITPQLPSHTNVIKTNHYSDAWSILNCPFQVIADWWNKNFSMVRNLIPPEDFLLCEYIQ